VSETLAVGCGDYVRRSNFFQSIYSTARGSALLAVKAKQGRSARRDSTPAFVVAAGFRLSYHLRVQNRGSRLSLPLRRAAAAVIGALALLGSHVAAIDVDPHFVGPELAQRAIPQRLLVLPDDSFLTYWTFNRFNGQNAGLILKFKKDGTLDPTFRFTGPYVHVIALTPAPGGKFIVAVRQREKTRATYPILRLNSDGSVDPDFDAGSGADRDVYGLAVQTDGKILVGGTFENFNGEARQGIVRLQPNGAIDTTFAAVTFDPDQPSSAAGIRSKIIVQPDSKILFGGSIGAVNGVARDGVARLNENGSLDSSFVPAAPRGPGSPQQVTAIELQPDGKVLVAGRYAPAGSSMISPLVRLNANGSADTYFPGRVVSGSMFRPLGRALNLRPNGDIIVAGDRLYLYSAAGTERSGSQQTTISGASFGLDTTSDGSILLAGDRTGVRRRRHRCAAIFSGRAARQLLQRWRIPARDSADSSGAALGWSDLAGRRFARPRQRRAAREGRALELERNAKRIQPGSRGGDQRLFASGGRSCRTRRVQQLSAPERR
jgi:uncharacterized delta-60 repeat protein